MHIGTWSHWYHLFRTEKENKAQTLKKPAKKEKGKAKKSGSIIIKISSHVAPGDSAAHSDLTVSSGNNQTSSIDSEQHSKQKSSESTSESSEDSQTIKSLPPPLSPLRIQPPSQPAIPPSGQPAAPHPSQSTIPPFSQPAIPPSSQPAAPPSGQPAAPRPGQLTIPPSSQSAAPPPSQPATLCPSQHVVSQPSYHPYPVNQRQTLCGTRTIHLTVVDQLIWN